ncbi:hypothetical protein BDV30DRAFT_84173 [Aspergillus minisclerotigenes]|uniref:Uncharacterized protein n=1 Tax=Aspergillus minisclerotigenes TaxID=656917 RepID=A0A5N6J870_9EURO|nr:hypothetical protein BDV30DRAFT_84173 [Aspergillus minisclerotigenes]
MFAVLYTFHDSNCADRGGRGKSSSYTLEHLYAFTRCLRFVSFFEHTVCNSVTTSEASLLLPIACLTPCRSLTIISSWILSLHFFLLFPYLPDVLPISMDSMVFSIHTGHCILTLLFVLSLHFSALPMVVDGGRVRSHGLC